MEEQSFLDPNDDGTFDDFGQMVVQFGYLALFAPACSLAPLLAFINNVTEIRTDAYKWCMLYRRPIWERCDTIGAWNTVMKILALTSVATNATMICFVGSQLADPLQIEETESIDGRIASTKLWVYVMVIEHAVVILKAGLSAISPTQPQWIVDAKAELEIKRSMMITKDDANRQRLAAMPGTDPEAEEVLPQEGARCCVIHLSEPQCWNVCSGVVQGLQNRRLAKAV